MTDSSNASYERELARLRDDFRRQLPQKLAAIEAVAAAHCGDWQATRIEEVLQLTHRLAGSAGSFGFGAVSVAARALEFAATACLEAQGEPPSGLQAAFDRALGELVKRGRAALAGEQSLAAGATARAPLPVRPVVVVEDDSELAQAMAARLASAGYAVHVFADLTSFKAVCAQRQERPAAIVMDVAFPEGPLAGIDAITELRQRCRGSLPVVFLLAQNDIETRLKALRAGATRSLPRPLDLERLVRLLDELTLRQPPEPYRVLLVDDNEDLLALYARVLRGAGMAVSTVSNPLEALEAARELLPDVIVLDVYMPEASGYEVAAILREERRLAETPILFLSAETDIRKQLVALDLGGDDFLCKPIEPAHLVTAVAARAKRARRRRELTDELRRTARELGFQQRVMDEHAIVSVTDASGTIVYVNDRFCKVSGYAAAELIGGNHRIVKSGVHAEPFYREMWETISSGRVWRGEICNRRKDGRLYWVEATIVPVLDDQGLPYEYVSVRTEITAVMEAEERLRRSQLYANIGTWDWNIETGELYWSERIAPLFGHAAGQLATTYENFLRAVHPDDRQTVADAVNACVEHGAKYDIEHRVVWPDGTVRWLLERGDVTRDARGKPLHMLGVVQDITARKQAEAALRESEASLANAQRIAHLGSWGADLASGELRWSDEVYRIFGREPGLFVPSYEAFLASVHPDDAALVKESERRAVETGVFDVAHRIVRPDGSVRHVRAIAELVRNPAGGPQRLIGTVQDITALKETEIALIAAKDEAERANNAKSEFLSNMSHELRTPMNAILGFAQLLEVDPGLSADQRDSVGEILRGGRHLLELINEILDLARIEAGRIELSLEPVSGRELLEESLSLVRPLAAARDITIHADAGQIGPIAVRADRTRLKQVLVNLLSNAVKYNHDEGEVRVTVAPAADNRVRFTIADTGPGIPHERQRELFKAFSRLVAPQSGIEGTGIGLVISKRLIETMGGAIGFDSEPGRGSRFWVELPGDAPRLESSAARRQGPAAAAPSVSERRATVLYVEDNPANLRLVSQLLSRRAGVNLYTAHTPELGLELARTHRPQLILLDINMPNMDGYEVLARLRAEAALARVPVVAVTANAMARDVERGRRAGFADYLTKPLDVGRFYAVVDRLLEPG